jgi:hypothetical protein
MPEFKSVLSTRIIKSIYQSPTSSQSVLEHRKSQRDPGSGHLPCSNSDVYHRFLVIPIALRPQGVDELAHLLHFLFSQFDIPGAPILYETMWFGCTRDSDHTLSCYPRQCNLCYGTLFLSRKLAESFCDLLIRVEILALELGDCSILDSCCKLSRGLHVLWRR